MTPKQFFMLVALVLAVATAFPAAKKIYVPGRFGRYLIYLLFLVPFWLLVIFGTEAFK